VHAKMFHDKRIGILNGILRRHLGSTPSRTPPRHPPAATARPARPGPRRSASGVPWGDGLGKGDLGRLEGRSCVAPSMSTWSIIIMRGLIKARATCCSFLLSARTQNVHARFGVVNGLGDSSNTTSVKPHEVMSPGGWMRGKQEPL
jgi:hypothetical protein